MDLHLVPGAEPTAAERAALDGVLGPARDGWDGGARLRGPEGNTAAGGHSARERRHLLLPALWALQEHIGWISPGGLNELCRRLTIPPADAYGVATFYAMLAVEPRPARVVHVCEDVACRCNGSDELIAQLEERFGGEGELSADGSATWYRSPASASATALRQRSSAMRATRRTSGRSRRRPRRAVLEVLEGGDPGRRPGHRPAAGGRSGSAPACGAPRTAARSRSTTTARSGGYAALRRAVELGPEGVIRELKDSKLQGRGGAAFPTGVKWEAVARQPVRPHYLVCNADESEPGTFKDRVIMELDPFALIESMTIAAYATGCERGLRLHPRRVPGAAARARGARSTRRAARLPRRRRHRRGLPLRRRDPQGRGRLHLRRGDGDLRVDRGQPRRAAQQAAVPRRRRALRQADGRQQRRDARQRARHRLALGPRLRRDRHRRLDGHEALLPLRPRRAPGCLRGAVRHDAAGAARARRRRARAAASSSAVLMGGAAGGFLRPDELDLPLTFEAAREAKTTLGSGVVLVLDDTVDLPRLLHADRGLLPQRVVRPVRSVPGRHGAPAGGARAARLRQDDRRGRARARRDRRGGPVHARRVDLRPRPDGVERDRVRDRAARGVPVTRDASCSRRGGWSSSRSTGSRCASSRARRSSARAAGSGSTRRRSATGRRSSRRTPAASASSSSRARACSCPPARGRRRTG